jgi:hypothetical protein
VLGNCVIVSWQPRGNEAVSFCAENVYYTNMPAVIVATHIWKDRLLRPERQVFLHSSRSSVTAKLSQGIKPRRASPPSVACRIA